MFINPHKTGLHVAPMQSGHQNIVSLQCLLPADPKVVSEDSNKMLKYQYYIHIISASHNSYFFGFTFLDLLKKLMKERVLYALYSPPSPPTCDSVCWAPSSSHMLCKVYSSPALPLHRKTNLYFILHALFFKTLYEISKYNVKLVNTK